MKKKMATRSLTDDQFDSRLTAMTWSFSRINSYQTCPKLFKLQYIDKVSTVENAFAQWGSLCHSIFERYLKGECGLYDMASIYQDEYDQSVTEPFPPNKYVDLNKSYHDRGLEVFNNYSGLPEHLEFVASEQRIQTTICNEPFVGYIDVLLRDSETGDYIVQDFKSKKTFKNAKERSHYAIQLYLYSYYVKEEYGVFPSLLRFDMFRSGELVDIPFSTNTYSQALQWFVDSISAIRRDREFKDKVQISQEKNGAKVPKDGAPDFFCAHLCGCRTHCIYSG